MNQASVVAIRSLDHCEYVNKRASYWCERSSRGHCRLHFCEDQNTDRICFKATREQGTSWNPGNHVFAIYQLSHSNTNYMAITVLLGRNLLLRLSGWAHCTIASIIRTLKLGSPCNALLTRLAVDGLLILLLICFYIYVSESAMVENEGSHARLWSRKLTGLLLESGKLGDRNLHFIRHKDTLSDSWLASGPFASVLETWPFETRYMHTPGHRVIRQI